MKRHLVLSENTRKQLLGHEALEERIALSTTSTYIADPWDDTLILRFQNGTPIIQKNEDFIILTGFNSEKLIIDGGGGNDTIEIHGSADDQIASLYPDRSRLSFANFSVETRNITTTRIIGGGGYDRAYFYDSSGNDLFTADPQSANMTGQGFNNSVEAFDRAYAFSGGAGVDTADLYDSPDRDYFVSNPNYARLSGTGFYSYASNFDTVNGHATGGHDRAFLSDSAGNDSFTSHPTDSQLSGNGFEINAMNFDRVYADSTQGGYDIAQLFDSSSDDYFLGTNDHARMSGAAYYNQVKGFAEVSAFGSGGMDRAYLFDSPGNDVYTADQDDARMLGGGNDHSVSAFDRVYAYSIRGGNDVSKYMALDTGDTVAGAGSSAMVYAQDRDQRAIGFDVVEAHANTGATPTDNVGTVDYTFEKYGW